ncbi:hypothetical protein ID866_693 [Astraeus odoratus]|nr:hypothetical protein ID866_693 [Astraeus odoratus]
MAACEASFRMDILCVVSDVNDGWAMGQMSVRLHFNIPPETVPVIRLQHSTEPPPPCLKATYASTIRLYCTRSRDLDTRVQDAAVGSASKSESSHNHAPSGRDMQQTSWGPYSGRGSAFPTSNNLLLDAALTSIVGLGIVFIGGVAYIAWYKKNVLDKIERAFDAGYDPILELANFGEELRLSQDADDDEQPWQEHLRRKEQDLIDEIIHGQTRGHYYFLIGPKGGGKSTMMLDAMREIHADGVSFLDAHPDLEVFRLRLGKALNYEFHEDSQTGLFQRRDPRESGPALDIERALNKLEKVALRKAKKTGKPIVLVFNNIQHFNNDEDGRNMLLQLQQKAETWAAGGIVTTVFSSSISVVARDDFWPYLMMRQAATRMHVVSIGDLSFEMARHALARMRVTRRKPLPDQETIRQIVSLVGGRLSYLSKVSRMGDMLAGAREILRWEQAWLLSQIGLIPDCDDDVMDEVCFPTTTEWF